MQSQLMSLLRWMDGGFLFIRLLIQEKLNRRQHQQTFFWSSCNNLNTYHSTTHRQISTQYRFKDMNSFEDYRKHSYCHRRRCHTIQRISGFCFGRCRRNNITNLLWTASRTCSTLIQVGNMCISCSSKANYEVDTGLL